MFCGLHYINSWHPKTTHIGYLLNDDVLNFSVDIVKDLLNLNSALNAVYCDKTIIYHFFNADASQNSI